MGWSGMRGVVSLAAALSLPLVLADGRPFPARSLIIFITFAVILGTLVFQGLTLAPLVRWLRVEEDRSGEKEERRARLALAEAALDHLDGAMDEKNLQAHQVHGVRQEYVQRVRSLKGFEAKAPRTRRSSCRRSSGGRQSRPSGSSSSSCATRKSSATTSSTASSTSWTSRTCGCGERA